MFYSNYKYFYFKNYLKQGFSLFTFLSLFFALEAKIVQAQSITPDSTTQTTINQDPNNSNKYNITGKERAGNNLFHSFKEFSLKKGEIANFIAENGIENILGRVTGSNASLINGILTISGEGTPTPNLYLMNPAGIIFGKYAKINLPASFTATTANGIQIGGFWFDALGENVYRNLSGEPIGFAFIGSDLGTIINSGEINVGVSINEDGNIIDGPSSQNTEATINLVGGWVINTGKLKTPEGGIINIVAVPEEKLVTITPNGSLLSLALPTAAQATLQPGIVETGIDPLALPELLTGRPEIAEATAIAIGEDKVIRLTSISNTEIPRELGTTVASGKIEASDVTIEAGKNLIFDRDTLVEVENNNPPKFIGSLIEPDKIDSGQSRPLEDVPIFQNLTLRVDPPDGTTGELKIQGSFAVIDELLVINNNGDIIIDPQLPGLIKFGTDSSSGEDLKYSGSNGSLFIGFESILSGVEPVRNDDSSATITARQGEVRLLKGITLNADTTLSITTQKLDGSGTTTLLGNGLQGEPRSGDSQSTQTYTIGFISSDGESLDLNEEEQQPIFGDDSDESDPASEPNLQLLVSFNPDNPNLIQPEPVSISGDQDTAATNNNIDISLLSDESFEVGTFTNEESGIASIKKFSLIIDNGSLVDNNVSLIEESSFVSGNPTNSIDQEQISNSIASLIARVSSPISSHSQGQLASENSDVALEIKSDSEVAAQPDQNSSTTQSTTAQSATEKSTVATNSSSSSTANETSSNNNSANQTNNNSVNQSSSSSTITEATTNSSSTATETSSNNNSANQSHSNSANQASNNPSNQTNNNSASRRGTSSNKTSSNSNPATQANSNSASQSSGNSKTQADSNSASQSSSSSTSQSSSNSASQSNSSSTSQSSSNSASQSNSSSTSQSSSNSANQSNSSSTSQSSSNSASQSNSSSVNQANNNTSNTANQANSNSSNLPGSKTSHLPNLPHSQDDSQVALLQEQPETDSAANPIKRWAIPIAGGALLIGGAGTVIANTVLANTLLGNALNTVLGNALNSAGNLLNSASNTTIKPEANNPNNSNTKSDQHNPQQDTEIEMEPTIEPGFMQLGEFPLLDFEISLEMEQDSGVQKIHIKDNFVNHAQVQVKG